MDTPALAPCRRASDACQCLIKASTAFMTAVYIDDYQCRDRKDGKR